MHRGIVLCRSPANSVSPQGSSIASACQVLFHSFLLWKSNVVVVAVQRWLHWDTAFVHRFVLHLAVWSPRSSLLLTSHCSCAACTISTYKDVVGSGLCTQCPAGKTSNAGATSLSSCYSDSGCSPGKWHALNATCYCALVRCKALLTMRLCVCVVAACAPGRWSAGGFQSSCTLCPAGVYGATR